MTAPDINFASSLGKRHRARVSLKGALLTGIGLAVLGTASWRLAAVELKYASVRSEIELAQESLRTRQPKPSASVGGLGRDEIVAINKAIRQLNLPWPQLFDAVESATPDAIAVLSLTPDPAAETLTIAAESLTTESMLSYVRLLKAQPLFDEVSVGRHEINDKDPHKPIRFEVAAHWRPQQ